MDDIKVKKMEAATIGSGAEALLRPFRRIWEHKVTPTEWKHSAQNSQTHDEGQAGLLKVQGH